MYRRYSCHCNTQTRLLLFYPLLCGAAILIFYSFFFHSVFSLQFQISSISVVTTCTNTETNSSQTTGKSSTKSQRSDDISVISEPRRNHIDIEDEHSSIVEENSTAVQKRHRKILKYVLHISFSYTEIVIQYIMYVLIFPPILKFVYKAYKINCSVQQITNNIDMTAPGSLEYMYGMVIYCIFEEKVFICMIKYISVFWIKYALQKSQNWLNKKITVDPSPHKHSLQTHNIEFFICAL